VSLSFVAVLGVSAPVKAQEEPPKEEKPKEDPPPDPEGGSQMMSGGSGANWVSTESPPVYDVSGFTGGFSTEIPILVPSYHGLEPGLALSYNSSGGNGFVGAGWELSGFSVIERRNKDGGWPRFDGTDTYWLGGQKLVPCGGSGSPGCTSGGTHFAEVENYLRIDQVSTDSWTVTSLRSAPFDA
jgi:hypothetical protein